MVKHWVPIYQPASGWRAISKCSTLRHQTSGSVQSDVWPTDQHTSTRWCRPPIHSSQPSGRSHSVMSQRDIFWNGSTTWHHMVKNGDFIFTVWEHLWTFRLFTVPLLLAVVGLTSHQRKTRKSCSNGNIWLDLCVSTVCKTLCCYSRMIKRNFKLLCLPCYIDFWQ